MASFLSDRAAAHKISLHNLAIVLLAAGLIVAHFALSADKYGGASLHFWLQAASAALWLGVAYIGIKSYLENGSKRLFLTGLAFFSFAALEVPYSFSSPGGLALLVPSDANVALWFWEAGQLLGSGLLLMSVLISETVRPLGGYAWARVRNALFWLASIAVGTVVYAWLLASFAADLPSLWSQSAGITSLETTFEWVAVFLQIVVALAYVQRYLRLRQGVLLFFSLGTVCLGFAGVALTVYRDFYDSFFWVGQAYQILGCLFFAGGVWCLMRREP